MKIEGDVTDKNKAPIANALVEIKGENFVTLFSTESKEDGYYVLDIERAISSFNFLMILYASDWDTPNIFTTSSALINKHSAMF